MGLDTAVAQEDLQLMDYFIFNGLLLMSAFIALLLFSFGVMTFLSQLAFLAKSDPPSNIRIYPLRGIAGIAQLFFWGLWSALCVVITITYVQRPGVTWQWLYWVTGFMWCTSLMGWLVHKERPSGRSPSDVPNVRKGSTAYASITIVAFIVFAYSPTLIAPPFGWILKPLGLYENSVPQRPVNSQIDPTVRQSIEAFFAGYQLFNTANKISQELEYSQDRSSELEKVKDLLNNSKNRLAECDTQILNKIYDGWGDAVSEKFIPAISLIVSGLKTEADRSDMIRGDALMSELGIWLQNNWDGILLTLSDRYDLDINM